MNHILITTDFSPESMKAFTFARELLAGRKDKVRITVLAVIEDLLPTSITFEYGFAPIDSAGVIARAVQRAREELDTIVRREFDGFTATPVVVEAHGPVHREITDWAKANNVSGIFISTTGRTGLAHALLGSISERVIRNSPCPVFVVPTRGVQSHHPRRNIIALTDFSQESRAVLPYAAELGRSIHHDGGQVILLHVVEDVLAGTFDFAIGENPDLVWEEREQKALSKLEQLRNQYLAGVLALTAVSRQTKSVAQEIVQFAQAREGKLIILGTHGRSGFNHLLAGSVAEQVVRLADCPVLVVPVRQAS